MRTRPTTGASLGALMAVVVTTVLLLSGCSSTPPVDPAPDSDPNARTVETLHGPVDVPADPERIVAVSYDTPWQLMSLGVPIVGAQDYSSFMGSLSDERKAYIDGVAAIGSYGEPNLEAIAALEPDLIAGDSYEVDDALYEQLSAIAPTVVATGEHRGDWKAVVTTLAEATNAEATLAQVAADDDATLSEIRTTHAAALHDLTFALITFGTDEATFSVMYPTGIVGSLYDELGVRFAPGIPDDSPAAGYVEFTVERVPEILSDADVIIAPAQADGSTYDAPKPVFTNPLFRKLPAAQSDHVFELTLGVTDYVTAADYLDRMATQVLATL